MNNRLTNLSIQRVMHLATYPEAARAWPPDVLTRMHAYGPGTVRSSADYLRLVGLDVASKAAHTPEWCLRGRPPA